MAQLWEPELDDVARSFRDRAAHLTAEHFAPIAADLDLDGRYPWESVPLLVEHGLAGMFVPREFGGEAASMTAICAVLEEVARGCASHCAILSVYLTGALPILMAGTDEQKSTYLRGLATEGEAISFALTEEHAGSDVGAIRASAEPVGDGYRLRGEKWFVGNGGASTWYVVFAKLDPAARRLTAFMVHRDAEGVDIDTYFDKMGIRGTLTSNLRLDTVVDADAMLGEPGRGAQLALGTLEVARIGVAAQALGVSMAALEVGTDRARSRETFGRPLIENQAIAFRLADVATEVVAARLMMYEAARRYDRDGQVGALSSMTKLYSSEVAHRAVDAAVQVFGGAGFCKPNVVERLYRDQRGIELYEGASEIQRMVISRLLQPQE